MAAPNLISATTINGKTAGVNLSSTSTFTALNNPASSGKLLKINTLNVSNYSAAAATVTIGWNNAANVTGTTFQLIGNVSIPAGTTLTVVDKSTQYYLEENTSISAVANIANVIVVTTSYEDIS